jgi:hypothetical protein
MVAYNKSPREVFRAFLATNITENRYFTASVTQRGVELPPVLGHLGSSEPMVKPTCKWSVLLLKKEE